MLNLMTIRCDQCGQENNPQYRFCGSCGAPLQPAPLSGFEPRPRHEPATESRRSAPVSGPSFLGLADESSRTSYEYLLDDEPQSRHALFYLILLLIVAGIAYGGWRWRSELYTLATRLAKRPAVSSSATAETPTAPDSSAGATAPATTPAPTTPPPAPNPTENAGDTHSATAVVEDGQSPTQPKSADSAPTPESNAALPPKAAGTPQQKSEEPENPAATTESSTSPKESKSEESPVTAKATAPTRPAAAKPAPTKVEAPTAEPDREDRLVADGERYLYGTGGVHEDCARAQRNLQIGARASNPKAYTLLGAMYATGHCVGRDLPTAYRWFARALHEQPSNTRLQQNLQVIWNQMTPSEKQIAANSRGQ